MANDRNIQLGISTSIIPGSVITTDILQMIRTHPFEVIEIGYEHAGPALTDQTLYDGLVSVCRDALPPIFSIHAPYRPERDISELDEQKRQTAVAHAIEALQLAEDMGVGLVVVHGSQDPVRPGTRPERLLQSHRSLGELVAAARTRNVRVALEMMPPEWLPAGSTEAHAMLDGLDPRIIGYCLDTNHANLTGDLTDIIHALADRLWSIHLSDNDGIKQQHWMPFEGIIDFPSMLSALDDIGYCGPVMYELDYHPEGPEKGLEEVAANFEKLCAY